MYIYSHFKSEPFNAHLTVALFFYTDEPSHISTPYSPTNSLSITLYLSSIGWLKHFLICVESVGIIPKSKNSNISVVNKCEMFHYFRLRE
jgi:hypothetical protein